MITKDNVISALAELTEVFTIEELTARLKLLDFTPIVIDETTNNEESIEETDDTIYSKTMPTDEQLKQIAQELDCGLKCYFNKKTREVKAILDSDDWIEEDENPWLDDFNDIEENGQDYVEIEKMMPSDSFRVMEKFTYTVKNAQLKTLLHNALENNKPFRNFKRIIENNGEYCQKWYDFKDAATIEWVKDHFIASIDEIEED